jgi:hypothetical protein
MGRSRFCDVDGACDGLMYCIAFPNRTKQNGAPPKGDEHEDKVE